jgi:serine/threonine protein kinase
LQVKILQTFDLQTFNFQLSTKRIHTMKDPLIGQQLANFRVERLLGQGGMATVYFGQDIKLQRPVAIKVIDKRYKGDSVYTQRFVNEARMMAKWRHENIVQIYYADDTKDASYYVMEYVDGQDLSTVMSVYAEEHTLMSIADVLRIGNAVASALDYAHRQGVIHRDVKPSNVLIAKDSRVLLSDFGMALEVRDGSMGNIFGTPHYISPEQARRSADAIPQSDLYSLGVILYEILTGSVPFNDPSPASIALQHISEPPPPPRSINPELSPAVEAVILKALEKEPQNRYQSGAKLMSALEGAFTSTGSTPKMPLPPLPVGAPTIQRSNVTVSQIAKREAPKKPQQPVAEQPATVRAGSRFKPQNIWLYGVLLLLFLGFGYLYLTRNGSPFADITPTPTFTPALPTPTELILPTQTLIPPSMTPTAQNTVAPTELPNTPTEQPATSTPEPSPTVIVVPTIKYPNGNNFTLFWNETSIHLLNRSREPRSLSAFAFERLDLSGNPIGRFNGSLWNNKNFTILPPKYCVSIKIFEDEDPPYINPFDCHGVYASIIQPRRDPEDRHLIFWDAQEDSTQFRVLWVDEEVARCDISAGTCEIYVP